MDKNNKKNREDGSFTKDFTSGLCFGLYA